MTYVEIYEMMQPNQYYTAKELGVAPATMTALVNRGLVEKTNSSPRKYIKIINSIFAAINSLKNTHSCEFFGLYKKDETIGMLCKFTNNKITDCWDKPYDLKDVVIARFDQKYFDLTSSEIICTGSTLDLRNFRNR